MKMKDFREKTKHIDGNKDLVLLVDGKIIANPIIIEENKTFIFVKNTYEESQVSRIVKNKESVLK